MGKRCKDNPRFLAADAKLDQEGAALRDWVRADPARTHAFARKLRGQNSCPFEINEMELTLRLTGRLLGRKV